MAKKSEKKLSSELEKVETSTKKEEEEKEEKGEEEEEEEKGETEERKKKKRCRKRKKKMLTDIVRQMEFYFSDSNLAKSKFMAQILEESEDGTIPLPTFMKFNKLRSMLESFFESKDDKILTDHLKNSLSKIPSETIRLTEDRVGRIKKFTGPRTDADDCTIYVENLLPHLNPTNDSLRALFERYGPVAYVSLPKYRHNDVVKGFAFIEFESPDSAKRALEGFCVDDVVLKKPSSIKPEELQSIKSFNIEQSELHQDGTTECDKEQHGPPPSKRTKTDEEEEEGEENEDPSKTTPKVKKRKNRKKIRKDYLEPETELQMMTLRVMSKVSWKKLRNEYLNAQRKSAAQSKKRLRKLEETTPITTIQKEDKDNSSTTTTAKGKEIEFVPDVIVKCVVKEPVDDPKDYKRKISTRLNGDNVQYVDIRIGAPHFYVRCSSNEQAQKLSTKSNPNEDGITSLQLLSGDEERQYWEKIRQDREDKLGGKVKRTKQKRGKTKFAEKIEKAANNHKFFADD